MSINIPLPQLQTLAFASLLLLASLPTIRRQAHVEGFSLRLSNELKGFAILAVVFSHIGYFLVSEHRFLYPLSIWAGVGVNLFLILSGYGLTISALNKPLPILRFYRKRLLRLFLPLWLILTVLFIADSLVLSRHYSFTYLFNSYLGYYPSADLATDIDSPLWYFGLIFFFYLVYPLLTYKKLIYFSPLLFGVGAWWLLQQKLPILESVQTLYKLHYLAFPTGVSLALLSRAKLLKIPGPYLGLPFLITVSLIFVYTSFHSNVGTSLRTEQLTSLISTLALVTIALVKKFQINLLQLFGEYSYEIYLIHWPILARYDLFYQSLPAFLATLLYVFLFLGLGFLIHKLC